MSRQVTIIALVLVLGVSSVYLGQAVVSSPDIGLGILIGGLAAAICFAIVMLEKHDRRFLIRLFMAALGLRWFVGYAIFHNNLQNRIGPDTATYDYFGDLLCQTWQGLVPPQWVSGYLSLSRSGWGMYYYVASVYYLFERNPLAILLINCALGAISCIIIYKIAYLVYPEQRVARMAAILTAVSPSMVLWTAQGMKESPIVFCLCLCALFTLKLCHKFNITHSLLLILPLFGLYSLRHYVFYVIFVAIAGALLFTARKFTPIRALQGMVLVTFIGLTFAYFGAGEVAQKSLDLKRIQESRVWGAKAANSGYGADVDITDTRAALIFLPVGIVYILLAPFPWMVNNLGQVLTLPEMLVWWAAVPLLFKGYWYSIRKRLPESLTICIFTLGLTLAYALFQTNAGTVHRQRTQLFVFFFVFVSIGWELRRSAKLKRQAQVARRRLKLPSLVPVTTPKPMVCNAIRQRFDQSESY